jgi:predicted Rossmann fold nucleotide-binding protein DprA/Smf involved in DNA uptake
MDAPRTLRSGDGPYPGLLAQIPDRPSVLRVGGDLRGEVRRAAIVGSREVDGYGEETARSIAMGPLSAGTHALLRAGARLAASAADVLAEMGVAKVRSQRSLPALSCEGSALLSALSRRPRHAGEVAGAAGLPVAQALAGRLALELDGLCEQRPCHYFLRREGN